MRADINSSEAMAQAIRPLRYARCAYPGIRDLVSITGEEHMQAIWNKRVIADSDDTVVVEGNHYFPEASVDRAYLVESSTTSFCPWKGTASYYSLLVDGETNGDAAWYYTDPKPAAAEIRGRIAFWRGVEVVDQ